VISLPGNQETAVNSTLASFETPSFPRLTRYIAMQWLTLLIFLSLTGCIPYPIYKKIQPEASMQVTDPGNKPLSGAIVTLISSSYPYGWEEFRETRYTNALGQVEFTGRREWRIEMMALHGWKEYFWNWRVEMPGYATYETRYNSADEFDEEAKVKLLRVLQER
jgi:hypothetical protein